MHCSRGSAGHQTSHSDERKDSGESMGKVYRLSQTVFQFETSSLRLRSSRSYAHAVHSIAAVGLIFVALALSGCGGFIVNSSPSFTASSVAPTVQSPINTSPLGISPAQGQVQISTQVQFTAQGGQPPYTFSVVSGGVTITPTSATTASVNTPTGNGSIEIQVQDAKGNFATSYLSVTGAVITPLQLSPLNPSVSPSGQVAFTVSGGVPPYTYSVATGYSGAFQGNTFTASPYECNVSVLITDHAGTIVSTVISVATPAPSTVQIYRLYNSSYGDHLYSTSSSEGTDNNYALEGPAFKVLSSPASGGSFPLYRCFYPTNQRHFLSTSAACDGQAMQSLVGYIYPVMVTGTLPLYRFVNYKGDTIETVNFSDGKSGYTYYGIMGYVNQ